MHMVPIVVVVVVDKENWQKQGLCFTCSRVRVKRTGKKVQVKFIITTNSAHRGSTLPVIEILQ